MVWASYPPTLITLLYIYASWVPKGGQVLSESPVKGLVGQEVSLYFLWVWSEAKPISFLCIIDSIFFWGSGGKVCYSIEIANIGEKSNHKGKYQLLSGSPSPP